MPHPEPAAESPAPLRGTARKTLRVFFAAWPDAAARDSLAALARIVAARTGGRAPAPENLHLTLAFVGDVAPGSVATLCGIGRAVAAAAVPFTLTLDRIGTFRGTGIAWAGTTAVPVALARMAQTLADALAAHEFTIDRRAFQPHLTLARQCRRRCDVAPGAPIAWFANRIVLNVSEPAAGGPRYRAQDGWPLAGADQSS